MKPVVRESATRPCPTPERCGTTTHHRGTAAAATCAQRTSMARRPSAMVAPACLYDQQDEELETSQS